MTTPTNKRTIETVYPLSPMQQGMLFHSLYAPNSGVYVEQVRCVLRGRLNIAAFEHAWQRVVERHPVLRTAFTWKRLDKMLQVVHRQIGVPVEQHDWRDLPASEQQTRLDEFVAAERQRGFDLAQAPLMRLVLMRVADDAYHFVWTHHHLILDGWSLPLLLKEVFDGYDAFVRGQALALPPARPYRDYIAWLQTQDLGAAEQFWRHTLRGFSAPTPLAIDRGRADENQAASYAEHDQRVSAAATAALQAFAQQHGLTLNTIVQGAWALLLSRYSGDNDVVFGITVAGRPPELAGSAAMVGLFINTLPLRVNVATAQPVQSWLQDVQARQVDLRQYEYSPLVEVQAWSEVPRGQPLFESILVFENYPVDESLKTLGGDLRFSDVHFAEQTNFPLTLIVGPGRELLLRLSYDTRRFDAAVIRRMLGHLQSLLEGIVTDATQPLSALPLLTAAEREQIVGAWNSTAVEFAAPLLLHALIEAQVARTPDAVAVAFADQQLTYAELNTRANQLAHTLIARGVGPETLVGICAERSVELVIGLLGILKAGGAYVPLDPHYPAERLAFMIQDAAVPVLLTQAHLVAQLPPHAAHVIALDADWPQIAQQPQHNPERQLAPDALAYMIYTSGSTGQPKGALNTHGGIVNRLMWMQQQYGLTAADRVLQKTPFSFDVSVWEFFWPLMTGARLVVAKPEGHKDSAYLVSLIAEHAITTLHFVPSMLDIFLQEPDLSGCTSLKRVICSGEALSVELQQRFFERVDAELHNLYGPTEAAVDVSFWQCQPDSTLRSVPIGWPVANTQLYILDRDLQPLPIGVPGELHIGGVQVGRGYLNRPELTAERFIADPFALPEGNRPAARLYKTGDLARFREDGAIEYLGRLDHQIKLRGQRIELGEIEAVLRQHAGVREAAVVAREDTPGDQRLVAYVVGEPGDGEPRTGALWAKQEPGDGDGEPGTGALWAKQEPGDGDGEPGTREQGNKAAYRSKSQEPENEAVGSQFLVLGSKDLRSFLATRLPEYMIPAAFVTLPALPLSANGKLDRRALPAPAAPATTESFVAPRTPTEELLADIWAEVLGVERVGALDNFFDLGGHSLRATQVVSRIRNSFGVEIALHSLFAAPTVRDLARQIEAAREGDTQQQPPIQPADRSEPLPLSFAQQRLWFLDQLEPNSALYNNPIALRLSGQLDVAALQRCLDTIVQRHEVLRTTFATVNGQPIQVVAPASAEHRLLIRLEDLRDHEQHEDAVRQIATAEAQQPFNLETGPLLRVTVLRLAEDQHVALITMHHIVSDGWSLKVLIGEVAALYTAFTTGHDAPLLPLSVQYADYAQWQRQWMTGDVLDQQLAYWKLQLSGSPPRLELPTDRPRPAVQTFRGATAWFKLPDELINSVRATSRRENVTLFMTLLAAFQVLLQRYSGQDDISVGTPIANRTRAEIEALIGCFVNTLVLRTDLAGNPSFRDVLQQVRNVTLNAYAHQDVPFEMVVEALQPQRTLSHAPLFQVMFVLDNAPLHAQTLPQLTLSTLENEGGMARFDMTLLLAEGPHGLAGTLQYNTDLFDAATIERLLAHYQQILAGIVADAAQPIAALPLLTEAERTQLLVDWNETATTVPAPDTFHALVAAQTARTPDAVAAIFDQQTLTYRELDARANQLAQQLHALGVGPDTIVGLCLDRSLDLVIAMLGVLKAGGAFLPLDPSYPTARLAFMLDDAHAPVLITHESLRALLPHYSGRRVLLETDAQEIAQRPTTPPAVTVTPDHLAYVIYTSGSTGQPKGTLLRHRGLCNLSAAQAQQFTLGPGDRVLQFAALSFDAAVWELSMALTSGAALVLGHPAQLAAGPALLAFLRDSGITTATLPPSLLAVLEPATLPALKTIIAAGEACSQEIVRQWATGRRFFNAYGPTEITVCATIARCTPEDALPPAIGRPLAHFKLYVLDREMQPVPIGVPGELYIGGAGLARGYLNRPELTAERFIELRLANSAGNGDAAIQQRVYRSGDLVRYRADGQLEFLGRIDQQVKLRGFRIELGEIEAALRQHPAVQDSLVLAREDGSGDTRLIGYVVAAADGPSNAELRRWLLDYLPGYMIPAAIVRLERWPMTPANKIDRAALPSPDGTRPELERAYVAPRTTTEQTLATICATLLNVKEVGVDDNFFELGGHSLLATQFLAQIRHTFDVELPLRTVFEQPTIADLAAQIDALQTIEQATAAKIAQLLDRVDLLSDEMVQALLNDEADLMKAPDHE